MDTYLTFEHAIGGCGGRFQTRLSMIRDFPEKVICPACPSKENPDRTEALKRFGDAMAHYLDAKNVLENDFNLRLID